MAVFTVNSAADIFAPPAGVVTLRSAIQAANSTPGPDTINLPFAGTYKIGLVGNATDDSAGELAIADVGDLTIQNTSGGTVTVDGGGLNRVFDVDPIGSMTPFTVTLQGLVITDGLALLHDGAGVQVHGAAGLVLNGCDVVGNDSTQSGGGIAMEPGSVGPLVLNATQVTGNVAGLGGGGIAAFGSGTVAIGPQSLITENAATGSGGGGGILVSGAPLNLIGAVVSNNRALSAGGAAPGGGIENNGAGPVSIAGSLIEDNSAASDGGGYDDAGLAALAIRDSFILDNTSGGDGGGLSAGGPFVTLTDTTVAGNKSLSGKVTDGGGGVDITGNGTTWLTDCSIVGNSALVAGGGIFDNGAASLIVMGSTVADNRALFQDGGGLYAVVTSGDVTISNSIFRDDVAGTDGGGLYMVSGTLEVSASEFTGNSASVGGAVMVLNTVLAIGGSTFDANRAANGAGALSIGLGPGDTLTNSTIVGNWSGNVGAVSLFGSGLGTMAMTDDTIDGNTTAVANAGGVYQLIGTLVVQGTIIAGNTAQGSPSDYDDAGGTLTDAGGNLLGSTAGSGGKFGPGTVVADPKLGPLEDNGGPFAGAPFDCRVVPTQALLPGSPAIGTGSAGAGAPTGDARGFVRQTSPSIGAYDPGYSSGAGANTVFVVGLYNVLLDRPADPAGLAAGVAFLNSGGTPTGLAQALESSVEFLNREAIRIVRRYLHRAPSTAEIANVSGYLASGNTPEQAASFFIGSAEFAQDYGNNQDVFLEGVYQTTLGRAAEPSEVAGWDYALGNGLTRPALVNLFVSSTAYLTDLIADDFVAYLGRPASPQDMAAFLKAAQSGVSSLMLEAILLGTSFGTRA